MAAEFTAVCKGCDEAWGHDDDHVYCPSCRPMLACEGNPDGDHAPCDWSGETVSYKPDSDRPSQRFCPDCLKTAKKDYAAFYAWESRGDCEYDMRKDGGP